MPLDILFWLLALGAVTGLLAGLLGIGGGMILVPFLLLVLEDLQYPPELAIKIAIATSLTTILFTAASSVRAHHKRGAVRWDLFKGLAPGMMAGTFLASQLVHWVNGRWLTAFFGVFLAWTALKMLRRSRAAASQQNNPPLSRRTLLGTGGVIGLFAAMLGAGGAFMTIPYLSQRGIAVREAIATSAACGFPIALAGTIAYVIAGNQITIAGPTFGYIYWPALAAISASSVFTAPLGARLAHSLPVATMRGILGCLLLALSVSMLWRTFVSS